MRLSIGIATAAVLASTVTAHTETIVQSVEVAASGSPAGVNMPECRNGEKDLPGAIIEASGNALDARTGSSLPSAIIREAENRIRRSGSVCGSLCFVLPTSATVHPTASTLQVFSLEYPWGPAPINVIDRFHVHDLQNWSGLTGP